LAFLPTFCSARRCSGCQGENTLVALGFDRLAHSANPGFRQGNKGAKSNAFIRVSPATIGRNNGGIYGLPECEILAAGRPDRTLGGLRPVGSGTAISKSDRLSSDSAITECHG
jgi:hypothetical protein